MGCKMKIEDMEYQVTGLTVEQTCVFHTYVEMVHTPNEEMTHERVAELTDLPLDRVISIFNFLLEEGWLPRKRQ